MLIAEVKAKNLCGWFVPITTLPLSQPNQRSITQYPLKMHRLPTSAHANLNTKIQIAPPKFCIKLSQQQPKICRHAATFLTEPITARQSALRQKRNTSENWAAFPTGVAKISSTSLQCCCANTILFVVLL